MIEATSCGGVVIFRGKILVLYKNYKNKYEGWVLPKGTVEPGEEFKETALREVKEEVGLTVALSTKFRSEDAHTFIRNGEERLKHIVYFLGEYSEQTPTAQETELSGVYLMNYETAMSAFQFESSKRLLTDAHNFLMQQ